MLPLARAFDRPEVDAQTSPDFSSGHQFFLRVAIAAYLFGFAECPTRQTNVLQLRWPNGPLSRAEKRRRNRKRETEYNARNTVHRNVIEFI